MEGFGVTASPSPGEPRLKLTIEPGAGRACSRTAGIDCILRSALLAATVPATRLTRARQFTLWRSIELLDEFGWQSSPRIARLSVTLWTFSSSERTAI